VSRNIGFLPTGAYEGSPVLPRSTTQQSLSSRPSDPVGGRPRPGHQPSRPPPAQVRMANRRQALHGAGAPLRRAQPGPAAGIEKRSESETAEAAGGRSGGRPVRNSARDLLRDHGPASDRRHTELGKRSDISVGTCQRGAAGTLHGVPAPRCGLRRGATRPESPARQADPASLTRIT
jgi:hypothetical protein